MVADVRDSEQPSTSHVNSIQVINVTKDNLTALWPELLINLGRCDYLAIDLELSGLGNLAGMRTKNVGDRYKIQRDGAMSRSVLSFGLAFFRLEGKDEDFRSLNYSCQVYNILTLCSQAFTIEPDALKFLAKHSFDFNRLISHGVPYSVSTTKGSCSIRSLFTEILASSKPLLFHNGLTDVLFLYHHFYSPLPESWGEFCNALSDIFPAESPLCDSKYLSEFEFRTSATFLEYVFRKCQRDNVREAAEGRYHIGIRFPTGSNAKYAESVGCALPDGFPSHPIPSNIDQIVCSNFANHGFCFNNSKGKCNLAHDVDLALDLEWKKKDKERQKRKRKFDHLKPESLIEQEKAKLKATAPVVMESGDMPKESRISVIGCHRAGVDAFMTGFAVLFNERVQIWRNGCLDTLHLNKIPLSGKEQPFVIQPTHSAGSCPLHEERFAEIRSRRAAASRKS